MSARPKAEAPAAKGKPVTLSALAQKKALGAADFRYWVDQGRQVVAPAGPVFGLPDVEVFSAGHAETRRGKVR